MSKLFILQRGKKSFAPYSISGKKEQKIIRGRDEKKMKSLIRQRPSTQIRNTRKRPCLALLEPHQSWEDRPTWMASNDQGSDTASCRIMQYVKVWQLRGWRPVKARVAQVASWRKGVLKDGKGRRENLSQTTSKSEDMDSYKHAAFMQR